MGCSNQLAIPLPNDVFDRLQQLCHHGNADVQVGLVDNHDAAGTQKGDGVGDQEQHLAFTGGKLFDGMGEWRPHLGFPHDFEAPGLVGSGDPLRAVAQREID